MNYSKSILFSYLLPNQGNRVFVDRFIDDRESLYGLMKDDQIITLDDMKIKDFDHLISLFIENKGEPVEIEFLRKDEKRTLTLDIPATYPDEKLGIAFKTDTPFLRYSLSIINPFAPVQSLVVYFIKSLVMAGTFISTVVFLSRKKERAAYLSSGFFFLIFLFIG